MTRNEYYEARAKLGQALRDLRWERRAIQLIFQGTRDPELMQAGADWVMMLCRIDVALCKEIIALDVRYQLEG